MCCAGGMDTAATNPDESSLAGALQESSTSLDRQQEDPDRILIFVVVLLHRYIIILYTVPQGCGHGSGSKREHFSNKNRKKARKLLKTAILFNF